MAFDDISINTIIGSGSAVSGNLRINGAMMIDGDIDGNIEASGNIIIGEKAKIRGNISARSATVSGIVLGDITAPEGIKLQATSTVIGDIATKRLILSAGVILHGHCIALSDTEEYQKEVEKQEQLKDIRNRSVLI